MGIALVSHAQPLVYKTANAHSHNDYEQAIPFQMAYDAGFGSIEADIFLVRDGSLLVAHDTAELKRKMSLVDAYLQPLVACLKKNNGYPYADTSKKLQMLIDIKTDSIHTLHTLVMLLKKYPSLIHCPSLSWVITGNRPAPSLFTKYPGYIKFDAILSENYPAEAWQKIVLCSDDMKEYSYWDGVQQLPAADSLVLFAAIKKAHDHHKPVRFWDAPDLPEAWITLMHLQVDYINTDHIAQLANFLNKH